MGAFLCDDPADPYSVIHRIRTVGVYRAHRRDVRPCEELTHLRRRGVARFALFRGAGIRAGTRRRRTRTAVTTSPAIPSAARDLPVSQRRSLAALGMAAPIA